MGRAQSIRVIEDDDANRTLLTELLARELDAAVRGAPDGPGGVAAAAREPPDLILLDLKLPGLGGLDVLRRLKASPRTAAIPVLAVTAATPEEAGRALIGGCVGCVRKPFDVDALLAAVRRYVGRPASGAGARDRNTA
jgi:CheY-like chemotaxis protein